MSLNEMMLKQDNDYMKIQLKRQKMRPYSAVSLEKGDENNETF